MRARFCPSPTGTPHVGLARTALFNWAFARHHGGTFVFRIEDTDAARDSEESYQAIVDALTWLGLDWDEGPDTWRPARAVRQSQRGAIYREVAAELLAAGQLYESYSMNDDVTARHVAAGRDPKLGYDNYLYLAARCAAPNSIICVNGPVRQRASTAKMGLEATEQLLRLDPILFLSLRIRLQGEP